MQEEATEPVSFDLLIYIYFNFYIEDIKFDHHHGRIASVGAGHPQIWKIPKTGNEDISAVRDHTDNRGPLRQMANSRAKIV